MSRVDKANGTFTTYQYDAAGQLTSLKNYRNATQLNSQFDYTYDARGRRASMTTLDGTWTYAYDSSGQLTRAIFASLNTANVANQDLTYVYDAAGNRTRSIENGVTTDWVVNNLNQPTTSGSLTQRYDFDGNLTFDGVNTYVYDQLNQLIRITGPQGVTEFEYDRLGSRIAVVTNGSRSELVIDPLDTSVVARVDVPAGAITRAIRGLGLEAIRDSSSTKFADYDALGSTVGVSGASGVYSRAVRYMPFGSILVQSGDASSLTGFLARRTDIPASGLCSAGHGW